MPTAWNPYLACVENHPAGQGRKSPNEYRETIGDDATERIPILQSVKEVKSD